MNRLDSEKLAQAIKYLKEAKDIIEDGDSPMYAVEYIVETLNIIKALKNG